MPNWCYTDISIIHNDENKVKALYEKIKEWTSKDYAENGFGNYWLGNVVEGSGICHYDDVRCRGIIQYLAFDGSIKLSTETAWVPMLKMWSMVCDKYLPDADITFTAEEGGCCLFASNDPDMIGKYYIDVYNPPEEFKDEEPVYDATEDFTIEFLQKVMKTKETDIKKLIRMADDEYWFSVNEWQEADISDFD